MSRYFIKILAYLLTNESKKIAPVEADRIFSPAVDIVHNTEDTSTDAVYIIVLIINDVNNFRLKKQADFSTKSAEKCQRSNENHFSLILYAGYRNNMHHVPKIFSRTVRIVSPTLSESTISRALSGRFVIILSTPMAIIWCISDGRSTVQTKTRLPFW